MDFLLNDAGDLRIKNGDFVVGDSQAQEIEALLMHKKGEWKQYPIVGGHLSKILKHRDGQTAALKESKLQLTGDGFEINNIEINQQSIKVDAERLK